MYCFKNPWEPGTSAILCRCLLAFYYTQKSLPGKVKLTKGLAVGAGLLGSAHSIIRRFSAGSGEIVTQAASSKVWSSRGKGGCHPLTLARKDQHRRGRAFSEPSLSLGSRNLVTGVFEKPSAGFRCRYQRDVIRRSHFPDIRYAGPMLGWVL